MPKTVMSGPPGTSVWPSITKVGPEGSGRAPMTSLPMVIVGGLPTCEVGIARDEVTPLTTTNEAEGASDIVVPEKVMAGPPVTRGSSPTTNDIPGEAEMGVKTLLPKLRVGAAGFAITDVTPLTKTKDADDANESVVPDAVIADPPGTSV